MGQMGRARLVVKSWPRALVSRWLPQPLKADAKLLQWICIKSRVRQSDSIGPHVLE